MSRWFALVLVLLSLGCSRKPKSPTDGTAANAISEQGALGALPNITVPAGQDEILVTVGEHTLSRSQADQDIEIRLAAIGNRLPPEQVSAFREDATGKLIEQFVVRSVLLDEAARAKIEVTAEDEQKALEKIGGFLEKQGRTIEEALEGSPLGRERMMEEVRTGVTVDKLLAQRLPEVGEATEEEITAFKTENAARLNKPERIHAHHVLLSLDATAEDAVKEARRAEAEKVRETLIAGASFDEVARTKSDCPSSARGGDLGWFERGQMVPAFESAAFSQPTGEVGGVVESPFGFHIIRVDEHQAGGEASREDIAGLLKQRKRQDEFKNLITQLMGQAKIEYADSIKPMLPESLPR